MSDNDDYVSTPARPSAYVVFCDDVRHEIGGKITLVGLYGHTLLASRGGAAMPKLVACLNFSYPLDMVGQTAEVTLLDRGSKMLTTQVPLLQPGVLMKVREDQVIYQAGQINVPIELIGFVPQNGSALQVHLSVGAFRFESPALHIVAPEPAPEPQPAPLLN